LTQTVEKTRTRTLRRQAFWIIFWVWYGISAVVFLWHFPNGYWQVSLAGIWWLVVLFREQLRSVVQKVHLAAWAKYFLLGLFFTDVVMETLAVSFQGDLNPDIYLNAFLWIGAYLGMLLGWWLVAHWYKFKSIHVFFLLGISGIIIEQNFMVPKMLIHGQVLTALLTMPLLIVVYGTAIAPVFLILKGELPEPPRRLNFIGGAIAVFLPIALFFLAAYPWFRFASLLGVMVPA
jgi:hypothetical protein